MFLLGATIALAIAMQCLKVARACKSTPPSVPGHWLFGNEKLLGIPWRGPFIAENYVPKYGDIFQLSTLFRRVLVLSSSQAVKEVLEKQAAVTSDRPKNVMLFDLCGLGLNVAFRNQDELQKKHRRVIASALHPTAARSYAALHSATSVFFLRDIANRINALPSVDHAIMGPSHYDPLIASIRDAVGRFIVQMTYGHVISEDDPLLQLIRNQASFMARVLSSHYWVNDFPILRYLPAWFPGASFQRDAKEFIKRQDRVTTEPFIRALKRMVEGTATSPSYVSKLLELKGGVNASNDDIELVKCTALPMFFAGSTTTVALILNFLFMMSIHPEIAARVQAEIDDQVGRNRLPALQDRNSMPYTDAALLEVMRFHPVSTLGIQHFTTEDIEVRGYKIRKGTAVEANIWALMHEPSTYPDPYTFNPDRFLKQTPDPDPRHFFFGFGRRRIRITAGEETMRTVGKHGKELWKMFRQYGTFYPEPFACTVKPRDQAALALLETCKEIEVTD
ncbi:cytochrome P450 family protein [Ceratobasidium sp. AG-Ba]|nr:cytochrome P450 family protein [Ceratobasidium sp. AG-Ba]